MLPIVRGAIFRHDSCPTAFSVADSCHRSKHSSFQPPQGHCTRAFLALHATHSPAVHTTDGFITPHVEQLHSPDPLQCQHIAFAASWTGAVASFEGGFRKTSKMAGLASRTRASNASSKARLGFRQRMSPSTVTLTPRPRSSVRISATWVIGAPCRRPARCREPQSKFLNFREPEFALSFQ